MAKARATYSAMDGSRGTIQSCHGWSGGTTYGGDHLLYDSPSSLSPALIVLDTLHCLVELSDLVRRCWVEGAGWGGGRGQGRSLTSSPFCAKSRSHAQTSLACDKKTFSWFSSSTLH